MCSAAKYLGQQRRGAIYATVSPRCMEKKATLVYFMNHALFGKGNSNFGNKIFLIILKEK